MGGVDAGVNDVGAGTLAARGVIGVRRLSRRLGREASKAPGRTSLGGVRVDGNHSILLNVLHLHNQSKLDWPPHLYNAI